MMCSVPSMCSRSSRTAPAASPLAQQPRPAAGAGRWSWSGPRRGGRSARSGRSSAPGRRSSRSPAAATRRPRRGRCGSGCRSGGTPRSRRLAAIRAVSCLEPVELLGVGALGGEDDRPGLDRDPVVEDRPGRLVEQLAGPAGERRLLGDEGAARAAAARDEVAALGQGRQRLAQGRARDREFARELALGRQLASGLQQAEPDRGAEPLDRLLEGASAAAPARTPPRGRRLPRSPPALGRSRFEPYASTPMSAFRYPLSLTPDWTEAGASRARRAPAPRRNRRCRARRRGPDGACGRAVRHRR